jgi:hypothetical protein
VGDSSGSGSGGAEVRAKVLLVLEKERRKDVRGLFVFAFTTGRRAQEGLEHFYRNNRVNLRPVVASEHDIRLEIMSNR